MKINDTKKLLSIGTRGKDKPSNHFIKLARSNVWLIIINEVHSIDVH